MKRNIIYAFFVSLALVLSACGSNSKEDPKGGVTPPPTGKNSGKISTVLKNMIIDKNSGNVSANVTVTSSYESTVLATLNKMNISLGGCSLVAGSVSVNPNTVVLNQTIPSKDVLLTGKMQDPACVPTSYQLSGTNTLLENGETTVEPFTADSVSIPLNSITFEDSSVLKLIVATKQLDINVSGAKKDITLNVLKGTVGSEKKGVKITNVSSIVGSFDALTVDSDASGDAVFSYTAPNPIVDNNFTVEFCLEENITICDTAKINLTTSAIITPIDPIDNINYFISFVPNGTTNNLALGTRNNAIATLIDKDTGVPIPSDRIKSITVTSRDLSILKLTPEGGGIPATSIAFPEKRNAVSVLLTADSENSGLALIEVVIEYKNLNGADKTRGQLFSIAVLSGEATAFSINDAGVGYNKETKQFEHKFIVQATDTSGNPIATTGFINVSAMASFAKDANGREILYGKFSDKRAPNEKISATISPNNGKATLELTEGTQIPFNTTNIKENRAFVAVFGGVETYEANGKWNLDSIVSDTTLNFSNVYLGEVHSGLGMAVGYNYRDKICTSAYEESVVVVDSTDGNYLLDNDGKTFVTLKYDNYMIGKRTMILVNMTGLNPNTGKIQRSGEVHEETLSFHLPLKGETITVPKGATNFSVGIAGIIDTGTEDEWGVYNSTFSCALNLSEVKIVSGPHKNDPTSCDNNGLAFLRYVVSATGSEKGSVTFKKCQVNKESKF